MPQMMPQPWRMLLLDRDPAEPRWILATVAIGTDVIPATLNAEGAYTGWNEVTDWLRAQLGDVALVPLRAVDAWAVNQQPGAALAPAAGVSGVSGVSETASLTPR